MLRFENIDFIWFFAAIPFLVILFIFARYARKRSLMNFGDDSLIKRLMPDLSNQKVYLKFIILIFAVSSIIIGLMNPQMGTKMEEVKREGIEIMIAVDVSNSMLAEDIKPSRIERAQQSLLSLIDKLYNDKIGIVLFAGDSFLQLPLTTDYSAAKLLISTISTDLIATQGTAIGLAIELAMESFSEEEVNKVLIIISDGENHEDDALSIAEEASDKGIYINTIGMGSPEGAPIPIYESGARVGFRKDKSGSTVLTKMNPAMLQQIASTGDGRFIQAGTSELDLESLINELSKIEKTEFESKKFTEFDDWFQYFFAAAFILLLIETILSNRKNKWITSLVRFTEGKK